MAENDAAWVILTHLDHKSFHSVQAPAALDSQDASLSLPDRAGAVAEAGEMIGPDFAWTQG